MLKARIAAASILLVSLTTAAWSATLSYNLEMEFSGATPPAGATPWLNATFDDGGTAGSVTLTLTATNLILDEFVGAWMFNLDPILDPNQLVFSLPTKTGSFDAPVISTSVDAYKADGDGYFDIQLDFATGGGASARFGLGEAAQYSITGIGSLTADSFGFLSAIGSGKDPLPTAAHIQSIGEDSGWITVPEPATLALLGMGCLGLLLRKRR
ncbi:MAG: PEP-CTERM sorting domain-containing protein [Sedimentisphaerales bacterium]|nr:PEP-CTERM sorting domain-containing protein [Sedimentisphaerales bacterium]